MSWMKLQSESSSTSCYDRAPHNIDSKEIMAFRHQNWQWWAYTFSLNYFPPWTYKIPLTSLKTHLNWSDRWCFLLSPKFDYIEYDLLRRRIVDHESIWLRAFTELVKWNSFLAVNSYPKCSWSSIALCGQVWTQDWCWLLIISSETVTVAEIYVPIHLSDIFLFLGLETHVSQRDVKEIVSRWRHTRLDLLHVGAPKTQRARSWLHQCHREAFGSV